MGRKKRDGYVYVFGVDREKNKKEDLWNWKARMRETRRVRLLSEDVAVLLDPL